MDPELVPAPLSHPALAAAVVVIAGGGALGAVARAGMGGIDTTPLGSWPWSTLIVNLSGSCAIGVLMVVLMDRFPASRFPRLFLGTGVLGGYTTFSAVTVEAVHLARTDEPYVAALYVVATVAGAAVACLLGAMLTRIVLSRAAQRPRPAP